MTDRCRYASSVKITKEMKESHRPSVRLPNPILFFLKHSVVCYFRTLGLNPSKWSAEPHEATVSTLNKLPVSSALQTSESGA